MKKVILVVAMVAMAISLPIYAEQNVKIGFVDIQKVLAGSQAGQKVKKEIESIVSKTKESLMAQEKEIQDLQKAFEKEQLTLSNTQREEKQKVFQKKVRSYKQTAAEVQQEAQKKESEFTKKALLEVKNIINDIAKKDKFNVLLEIGQSGMLYADDNMDVTQRVLKQFDIRYGG